MSCLGHLLAEKVGEVVRIGVKSLSVPFVGSITEHKTLVSSSEVIHILGNMDGISDLIRLVFDVNKYCHVLVVESLAVMIISYILAHLSCDLFVVDSWPVNSGLSEEAYLKVTFINIT